MKHKYYVLETKKMYIEGPITLKQAMLRKEIYGELGESIRILKVVVDEKGNMVR